MPPHAFAERIVGNQTLVGSIIQFFAIAWALAEGACIYTYICVRISRELSSNLSTKLRHALNNFQLRKLTRVTIRLIILWSTEGTRRGKATEPIRHSCRDTRLRNMQKRAIYIYIYIRDEEASTSCNCDDMSLRDEMRLRKVPLSFFCSFVNAKVAY